MDEHEDKSKEIPSKDGNQSIDLSASQRKPKRKLTLTERILRTQAELEGAKRLSKERAARERAATDKIAAQLKYMEATKADAERERLKLVHTKVLNCLGRAAIVAARRTSWVTGELVLTIADLGQLQPEEVELMEEFFRRDRLSQ
jgi:hypothetical protein